MKNVLKALDWAIKTANDNSHGYDQANRTGPDYDCSSFIAAALIQGGFKINKNSTTRNLLPQLVNEGFQIVTDPEKKPGDIFLNPGEHVVMMCGHGNIVHASINENGKISGGRTGDQNGKEIFTRKYYEPPKGWKYHLRYFKFFKKNEKPEITDSLINEIIRGNYGNGDTRKEKLKKLGFSEAEVKKIQSIVNKKLKEVKKWD